MSAGPNNPGRPRNRRRCQEPPIRLRNPWDLTLRSATASARSRAIVIDRAVPAERRNIFGHLDQEIAQGRRSTAEEVALHEQIGVDVGHRLLAQLVFESFGVLGGPNQSGLFGIPESEDDGTVGSPALFRQCRKRPRCFEDSRRPASRVHSAKRPGIMMRAEHHPAVWISSRQLARRCRGWGAGSRPSAHSAGPPRVPRPGDTQMADRPGNRRAHRVRATGRGSWLPLCTKEQWREFEEASARWLDPALSNRRAPPRPAIADRHAKTNCIFRCRPGTGNRRATGLRARSVLWHSHRRRDR